MRYNGLMRNWLATQRFSGEVTTSQPAQTQLFEQN